MKKKLFCALLAVLLLLSGCGKKAEPGMGSEYWEVFPELTWGVMEYEKLQVLPWNCGRCEATSFDMMAETELGIYKSETAFLYYADKADLSNWVPVCNEPNCNHDFGRTRCNARIYFMQFLARDRRIYYLYNIFGTEFRSGNSEFALMSMDPDGTDKKVIAVTKESFTDNGGTMMVLLTPKTFAYSEVTFNPDGTFTAGSYRYNGKEWELVAEKTGEEEIRGSLATGFNKKVYGDRLVYDALLHSSDQTFLRYRGDETDTVDLTDMPIQFSYLSGDVLRCFRPNDGYYDINIRTREEIKLADPQMENSKACVVLPNCIIESTLLGAVTEQWRTEGMRHTMSFFDGERWRDVKLPPELEYAGKDVLAVVSAVTSDSIWIIVRDLSIKAGERPDEYYRIDLTKENPELEYFTQFLP